MWIPITISVLLLLSHGGAAPPDAPFPAAGNKKGLQVQMVEDALALGIGHATLNVLLTSLLLPQGEAEDDRNAIPWTHNKTEIHVDGAYLASIDKNVQPLSEAGCAVYLILLGNVTENSDRDTLLLDPNRAPAPRMGYAGFGAHLPAGKAQLAALIDFLAARYGEGAAGEGHGRVHSWIVGNEVNSHGHWHSVGPMEVGELTRRYEAAVRTVHEVATARYRNARIYISLDHFWGRAFDPAKPSEYAPGCAFVKAFAMHARAGGDFPWHIAHHPYPEDLFDCAFWEDKTATEDEDTPRVTFKNLRVLGRALASDELRFAGVSRRVILSEQGFHRRPGKAGEALQAAAYAAAWKVVQGLPFIDAFILHRHVDHSREGGLSLGLWTNQEGTIATPDRKAQIYGIFQAAGTKREDKAFEFALEILAKKTWEEFLGPFRLASPKPSAPR